MGGTSPMCFSPIKIGQKEEETKKASFLQPLHRILPHFWLEYKRQKITNQSSPRLNNVQMSEKKNMYFRGE